MTDFAAPHWPLRGAGGARPDRGAAPLAADALHDPARPDGAPWAAAKGAGAARLAAALPAWVARRQAAIIAAAALAMLALAVHALNLLAAEADYQQVVATLLATSPDRIALALILVAASFLSLSLYDLNALRAAGLQLPWRRIAPGAMTAFAVSQTAGFGPLSGAAVRLRYYTPLGVSPADIGRAVVFVTASFTLGLVAVGSASALASLSEAAAVTGVSRGAVAAASLAGLLAVGALFLAGGRAVVVPGAAGRTVVLPGRGLMLRQLAVVVVDMIATAGVLWAFLPPGAVSLPALLPIFVVAVALGVLSHVPAGLGVFEAVMLAALHGAAPTADILAALGLYRLTYHALPLGLAVLGITAFELRRVARAPVDPLLAAVGGLAPQALAALSLLLGAMLVFSGVTPAVPADLERLAGFAPLPLLEGAHFLSSALGAVLMIAARGLSHRLDGAWLVALCAAVAALALSVAKALAVYEAGALAVFAVALAVSRRRFDRRAALLDISLTPAWIGAVGTAVLCAVGLLLFVYGHAEFATGSWLQFELAAEAPRGLRALVGAGLVAGCAAAWTLLRPVRVADGPPSPEALAQALAIARAQASPDGMMVAMGDKRLMFSEDGAAFVMYRREGRSWIALYDPVGPRTAWPGLIWRFVETARCAGGRAAFYEITPESLSLYAEAGLRFYKMGEEARIDLAAFDLRGGRRAGHRNVLSRGARDGLTVELLAPGGAAAVMDALAEVSRQWLGARGAREKAFSVAAFSPAALGGQRVAVLRRDGVVVAFVSLLETAAGEEAAAGVMRHGDAAPPHAMEFLFLRLCEILRAEGLRWFGLGMAPLAGLSDAAAAPVWQRLGHAVFQRGARSYNFKGLRAFKEGLRPVWRPRYLATARGAAPAMIALDAARLIARGAEEARHEASGS